MLNIEREYILPYIYNIKGTLVLDKNSGYTISETSLALLVLLIRDGEAEKDGWSTVIWNDDERLKVLAFTSNHTLAGLIVYKDNNINVYTRINTLVEDLCNTGDIVTCKALINKALKDGKDNEYLLDCLIRVTGLSVLYRDIDSVVLSLTTFTYSDGSRDNKYIIVWNRYNDVMYLAKNTSSLADDDNKDNTIIFMKELETKHIILLKYGNSLTIRDVGLL